MFKLINEGCLAQTEIFSKMKKIMYTIGLHLLLNLILVVPIFATAQFRENLTLNIQKASATALSSYEVTISTAKLAQEIINAVNDVEEVYNIKADTSLVRALFGIDDISFTAVIHGNPYPNIHCRLFISTSNKTLQLRLCESNAVAFQDGYIELPYESIIIGNAPMTIE